MALQLNTAVNADCLDAMKGIGDSSVDLIVTDPPYRVTARGNSASSMGGYWTTKITRSGKIFEHNDIDIQDYIGEFYRILKDGSHCYIMCNNLNLPHFFDVVSKSKFHFVKLLCWDKQSKICGRYYMGQIEHIFLLRKGKDKPINDFSQSDLISIANVREKDKDGNNIHDSQKPIALFQLLIENSSQENDIVLDPFAGSGTLAIACARSKRNYIVIEKDTKYYETITKRIRNEQAQLKLF